MREEIGVLYFYTLIMKIMNKSILIQHNRTLVVFLILSYYDSVVELL